ncbi:MAG: hypothetical protein HKN25_18490 [Pyrinomonadaceae bacterium]|nr:hypothetical protein [Pyrinomonadaceae bacterium]
MRSEIIVSGGRIYHLGLAKGELAKNIFLVGDPARAERVAKRFDKIDHTVRNREYVTITGRYRGLPSSVIGTGIGTDNVEIAVIEAYAVNEINFETQQRETASPLTFIRIGTSGGVQPDTIPGSMAIAEYGLGLDSTGFYYDRQEDDPVIREIERETLAVLDKAAPPGFRFKGKTIPYASRASSEVVHALETQSEREVCDFETGITVSSPGFYGPSSRNIEGFTNTIPDIKGQLAGLNIQGKRVINMEMESSLLFHLCGIIGYRASTICPMISNPGSSDEIVDYESAIEQAITIGLNAMLDLNSDHD